jgi:uncharacterized protein YegL
MAKVTFRWISPKQNVRNSNNYTGAVVMSAVTNYFGSDQFPVGNNAKRVFCVVLVDRSGSMDGVAIDELNHGLKTLQECLLQDDVAKTAVDISVVAFGHEKVEVVSDWCNATTFVPPYLTASGGTPLGAALAEGLKLIDARARAASDKRVAVYVPWLIVLTDGEPSDVALANQVAAECKMRTVNKKLFCLAVGVGPSANMTWLKNISDVPQSLAATKFSEFFKFVTRALSERASTPAQQSINPPAHGLFGGAN